MVAFCEQEKQVNPQLAFFLLNLYPKGEETHGAPHALEVKNLCLRIAQEPEYQQLPFSKEDLIILQAAALLHDIGYREKKDYWSGIQWEHPCESAMAAEKLLAEIPPFASHPLMLAITKFLILNHDNTSYSFPAYRRFEGLKREGLIEVYGTPNLPPGMLFASQKIMDQLETVPLKKIYALLQILKEADSRLGSAQRTIEFSKSRGIPVAADDGGIPGIGMPMWQYSGLTNVLLATNRSLLDAYTKTGQEFAWAMFVETREFIGRIINEEAKEGGYLPADFNNLGELLRREDVSRLISVDDVSDLVPVNESRLELLRNLRESLIKNYALDILTETSGALRVITDAVT